jgi:hypothetical protein
MLNLKPPYRVVYVGTGRKMRSVLPYINRPAESEHDWRIRLAAEQEALCNQMAGEGYRLDLVQDVSSSSELQGSWTEGVWMYFVAEHDQEHDHDHDSE